MTITRKEFLLSLLLSTTAFLNGCNTTNSKTEPEPEPDQYLISSSSVQNYTRDQLAQQFPQFAFFLRYGIKVHKLVYNTKLPDGTAVKASGAVIVPDAPGALPMVSQQHATILNDTDAPSYFGRNSDAFTGGSLFASQGFILVCPDYIGYGESKDIPHTYEHREGLAKASLDMLRAAREFVKKEKINWDERLYLAGYSEGAFATMSLQKMIEEDFPNEFNLRASSLGAGAYHKSKFLRQIINEKTHGISSYNQLYLWVLLTYNDLYKDLKRPMSFYLKEPYATQVQQNKQFVSIPGSLSEIFTDSFKKGVNDGTDKAFLSAIQDNDVYDWKPKTPTRLYHGTADQLVFYFNSQDAADAMKKRGATNVQLIPIQGGSHTSGITQFLLGTYDLFTSAQ